MFHSLMGWSINEADEGSCLRQRIGRPYISGVVHMYQTCGVTYRRAVMRRMGVMISRHRAKPGSADAN